MEMPKEDRQSSKNVYKTWPGGPTIEWMNSTPWSVGRREMLGLVTHFNVSSNAWAVAGMRERGGLWKHKLRFPILFDFQGTFASPPTMTNRFAWLFCVPERGGGDWLGLWIQVEPFRYLFDNHNVVVAVGQHCRERGIYEFTGQCLFKKIKMSYTR